MSADTSLRRYLPALIVVFALGLRLWGIGWGLPDKTHAFSYHPDETDVVAAALRLNPLAGKLDSQFYNYGEWAMLVHSVGVHLGELAGVVGNGPGPGIPSSGAYLVARFGTALMGSLTAVILLLTGRRLYGEAAGVVAGVLYAVAPLAVQHAHFATVDVPATFWIALTLFAFVRYQNDPTLRNLVIGGALAGLCAATKYNAGLVLLSGLIAWALTKPRRVPQLGVLLGATAVGFLVGCPGALLNTSKFTADLGFELQHARAGSDNIFTSTPPGLLYHPLFNLPWALGPLLAVLCGWAVFQAIRRREPGDFLLLAFLVPYFLLIGLAQVKFARYTMPLFPPLLLLVGALATRAPRKQQTATLGIIGASGLIALFLAAALCTTLAGTDPRDEMAALIKTKNLNTIAFARGPWFWHPPLNPLLNTSNPMAAKRFAAESTDLPHLIPASEGDWNTNNLAQADAVVLSEFEYTDALRLAEPAARTYIDAVKTQFPNKTVVGQPIVFLGVPITRLDETQGLPMQRLPYDMLYTNPTQVLFTK